MLSYVDSPLTVAAGRTGGPAPGERASAAAGVWPDAPASQAWYEQLRDPRWTLAVAEGADPEAPAGRHAAWLGVCTLADSADARGPGVLADLGGALRDRLGLRPGGWVLVRPDGYLAARGGRFTAAALERALSPAGLRVPAGVA
ncbi:hypothetical protein ABT297_41340 [Dactylosporangium sp. NPDC000555]|uniref:hypothetical protein n=1 Tax=Dactylosporangium sp. NPDC000555 TaxID=3154260 RepID=UPI0033223660